MSAFPTHPEVDAAITELADRLHAKLLDAVESAAARCLDRVEDDLRSRAADIGAASRGVTDFLRQLGEEIRAQSGAALSDGLKIHVIPALESQAANILSHTEQRIGSALSRVEGRVEDIGGSIGRAEADLRTVAKTNAEALSTSIASCHDALRDAIMTALRATTSHTDDTAAKLARDIADVLKHMRAADASTSQRDEALQSQLENAESSLARVVAEADHGMIDRFESHGAKVTEMIRNNNDSTTKLAAALNAALSTRAQTFTTRLGQLDERLNAMAARQESLVLRIWYLGLVAATLGAGVLVAVLTTR